jgi:hypothetical protein
MEITPEPNSIKDTILDGSRDLSFKLHDFGERGASGNTETIDAHAKLTGELVMADGVISKPNLGFPICPICKDSVNDDIY